MTLICFDVAASGDTFNGRTVRLMNRSEIAQLAEPEGFKPFVIVTSSGTRYSIDHPDYIDIPPLPQVEQDEEADPSYVTVYNRGSVARFIVLENIASIEFKPSRTG